jgi:hypothetical protein
MLCENVFQLVAQERQRETTWFKFKSRPILQKDSLRRADAILLGVELANRHMA